MRAIALSVILGAFGIECAIRKKEFAPHGFTAFLAGAWFVCLVMGW